jgi:uncharacterized membrane protein
MMNTNNKKFIVLSTIICLLPIAMYMIVYEKLPSQMGMQWNIEGGVNWYAPKAIAVFAIPCVLALIHLVSVAMRRNDPKWANTSVAMQLIANWTIPIVSILVCVYSILQNTGTSVANTIPLVAIGIILILIGNYVPKSRQNYTIGIRVPWTLSDVDNWNKTHRLAGYLWIAGGALLVVSSLIVQDASGLLVTLLSVVILMVLIPIGYSYTLHKKSGNDGQNKD